MLSQHPPLSRITMLCPPHPTSTTTEYGTVSLRYSASARVDGGGYPVTLLQDIHDDSGKARFGTRPREVRDIGDEGGRRLDASTRRWTRASADTRADPLVLSLWQSGRAAGTNPPPDDRCASCLFQARQNKLDNPHEKSPRYQHASPRAVGRIRPPCSIELRLEPTPGHLICGSSGWTDSLLCRPM
ncbi:hypothetical protein BS50DRAFT_330407 [Corynespora cassiicola Philippines]|uniref:Uncharacterized protein n=1 Tax=Corynespora cassiicola Philippines TaxID=1448308 RepID=A0A2T2NUN2_CORCC|nr:hypothetical protein BS50DRAFT_330407 [Corynespora cassiicola Philippines]